jgi:hypothetical protein
MARTPITVTDLTTGALGGTGVFDKLMDANKAHLEAEFAKNRITGADYAQVYLGALQATMNAAVSFLVERDLIALKADLLDKQVENEAKNGELIDAQVCKLKAEYDLTMESVTKTTKETELLGQKVVTEKAQTMELGVDDNSVIGKQKKLYQAQTDGFARDSEQKAAKIMIDTWNARRMTDDGTVADGVNKLSDADIGRAVQKMFTGVGI